MSKELFDHSWRKPGLGKEGYLYLRLANKEGYTYIADNFSQIPLKIAKPFYLDTTGQIFLYLMNPTGGMVQGDRLYLKVTLEPGAQAFITSQAATKIYRMENGHAATTDYFELGEGSFLEYFPDPIIPFSGARYCSEIEVKLGKESTLFFYEMLFPGRAAKGEIFQYDFYRRRTRVFYQKEIIYYDFFDLRPRENNPYALGLFEGYPYYGQLLIFSNQVSKNLSDHLHYLLQDTPGLIGSATLTNKYGINVHALSLNSIQLARALTNCWDLVRRKLVGKPIPKIRKY